MFADIRDDKIVIDSEDRKTEMLTKKYGDNIFGINKESKLELSKELRLSFFRNIKNSLYK